MLYYIIVSKGGNKNKIKAGSNCVQFFNSNKLKITLLQIIWKQKYGKQQHLL